MISQAKFTENNKKCLERNSRLLKSTYSNLIDRREYFCWPLLPMYYRKLQPKMPMFPADHFARL